MNSKAKLNTPILQLNHDILLTILQINGDMFEHESALWNTQRASYVCHSWRELTLASSSLWARLMDFDHFRWQKTHRWAREVLRRAGGASLWIKITDVQRYPKHIRIFFFQVLDNSWEQIERLNILMFSENTTPQQWDALYRRAPRLAELDLQTSDFDKILHASKDRPFFSNNAPSLLRFKAVNYKFSAQSPWLANLRSITIEAKFSLQELLEAVKTMAQLEFLRINRIMNRNGVVDVSQSLPTAHLSRLNHIKIMSSDLRATATFIKHLNVTPSCSLLFGVSHISKDDMKKDILEESFRVLARFVERYLKFYGTIKLSVACDSKNVSLKDEPYSEGRNYIDVSLKLDMGWRVDPFPYDVHDIFFKAFSFPCLRRVTVLGTKWHGPPSNVMAAFVSYLRGTLPSIETLDTDERTIACLLETQAQSSELILPKLNTVMLDFLIPSYFQNGSAIFDFLISRRDVDRPIQVLNLTKCNSDVGEPLPFLEKLTGLKVLWTTWNDEGVLEYVCGDGHPERLPY